MEQRRKLRKMVTTRASTLKPIKVRNPHPHSSREREREREMILSVTCNGSAHQYNATDEELNSKTNKFEIPSTETNNGNRKHLEKEGLSGLSPVTVQKLHDKNINNLEDLQNTPQRDADFDLIEEIDNEFTNLDVERNNLETPTELDASYQGSDKHNVSPNGTRPTPPANDHNNIVQHNVSPNGHRLTPMIHKMALPLLQPLIATQRYLNAYRASAFSFLQCFGGGSDDSVIIQDVQTRLAPTKNWLSKIFSSGDDVIIDVEPCPDQMHPAQMNPLQTYPVQTKPVPTQPGQTLHGQTQPGNMQPV
ncbi:hypothetical protein QYF36_003420 [Acer negundo]|nr:hypothetical protein QYF36_003420 [Acer negundo]